MSSLKQLVIAVVLLVLCACTSTSGGTAGSTAGGATGDTMGTATGTSTGTGTDATMGTESEAMAAKPKIDCSTVRCAACPDGQTPALKPPDCCRCVPVDTSIRDCSNVRCAACPTGQHPALTPPNCCRCVPD